MKKLMKSTVAAGACAVFGVVVPRGIGVTAGLRLLGERQRGCPRSSERAHQAEAERSCGRSSRVQRWTPFWRNSVSAQWTATWMPPGSRWSTW